MMINNITYLINTIIIFNDDYYFYLPAASDNILCFLVHVAATAPSLRRRLSPPASATAFFSLFAFSFFSFLLF